MTVVFSTSPHILERNCFSLQNQTVAEGIWTHDVYRTITVNRSCNVVQVNPSGKNSIRCQTYAKTEDHIEPKLCFNSRHPQHRFSTQQKMRHLRRKKSMHLKTGFLSDYQVLFLHLNGPQIGTSLKFNRSISINLWRQKVATRWFCPFPLNRGNLYAKDTKDFLIWVLLVKRGHILAFYRPNFTLQT